MLTTLKLMILRAFFSSLSMILDGLLFFFGIGQISKHIHQTYTLVKISTVHDI